MPEDQPNRPQVFNLFVPLLPDEWRRAKWAARRMKRADGTPASLADWAASKLREALPPPGVLRREERAQAEFPGTTPETAPADPATKKTEANEDQKERN